MSSKLNVKQSKKDRPKSSDKLRKGGKREGTPDKPTTPSHDPLDEEENGAKKSVIINDEILALQIKPENLEKLREPRPPSDKRPSPANTSVTVRKLKPAGEWDKPPTKTVTVARPAPPEAPLKPTNLNCAAGPRYDQYGNIIPHSILGDVEDFKRLAVANGDMPAETKTGAGPSDTLSLKYEKKKKCEYPKFESTEESNALKNWQRRMLERKKQQGYLSKLLNKPADQLVMNQADSYRKTQELRYIIDRTIPAVDYGKGYRVGSEFWKQQERIGDDITGLHMTVSQSEKGYPPPYENIGIPNVVHKEKGSDWERPKTPFHKPWHKSAYLAERSEQLQPIMKELVPHKPDLLNLEIVGGKPEEDRPVSAHTTPHPASTPPASLHDNPEDNKDPLSSHPDVHPTPVFGPSLQFGGQAARWTGDSTTFAGQVGIEARVSFETYAAKRTTSFLEIVNDGTTAIYYDWKPIVKSNPFEVAKAKVQRFYFNTSSGVILPGDTMKFPFVFKSPNAGVFSEQWEFNTQPVVCGGASLVVTLRGVAIQQDKYKKQRTELELDLAHKQAEQVVKTVLDELLEGIRSPERPASPVDAYITQQEIFSRKNTGLYYDHELVMKVADIHREIREMERAREREAREAEKEAAGGQEGEAVEEQEEEPLPPWDLSVVSLKEEIMMMDEDAEHKQDLLNRLNSAVLSLSFPPLSPSQQQMFNSGYQILAEALDTVFGEGAKLRASLGLPEKDTEDMPEEPTSRTVSPGAESFVSTDSAASRRQSTLSRRASARSLGSDHTPTSAKSERGDGKKTAGKGGKQDKDKKGKDGKGGKESKSALKDSGKGAGKASAASKRPVTREKERPVTPPSGPPSPTLPGIDPILEAKYKEKLYSQSYVIVGEMLERMDTVFKEIQHQSGGPKLPVLT